MPLECVRPLWWFSSVFIACLSATIAITQAHMYSSKTPLYTTFPIGNTKRNAPRRSNHQRSLFMHIAGCINLTFTTGRGHVNSPYSADFGHYTRLGVCYMPSASSDYGPSDASCGVRLASGTLLTDGLETSIDTGRDERIVRRLKGT